jgi:hypothetical protein
MIATVRRMNKMIEMRKQMLLEDDADRVCILSAGLYALFDLFK